MRIIESRKGELLLTLGNILWAFFPVIVVLSYAAVPSLVSLGVSTLFAAALFGSVIVFRNTWREMNDVRLWKYAFYIALSIGVLFYGLYYIGLEYTSPGNAALIALFEVFTTYILFNVWRRERITREHFIGALLMVLGAGIVLFPNMQGINVGDFIVLGATFFTPIGNYFQQKAREFASSETILFLRSILSAVGIFAIAYLVGQHVRASDMYVSLPFLILNGALLLGFSKILWIEGIHRVSVTKAVALGSMTPALTLLVAWALLDQAPNIWQLASLVPLVLGILLLTDQFSLRYIR